MSSGNVVASLIVEIGANTRPLTAGLQAAEREMQAFGSRSRNAGQSAGDGFREAEDQATSFTQRLFFLKQSADILYQSFAKPIQWTDEMAQMGAESLRSKAALEAVAGGAQQAEQWINAMKTATKGAITETEAAGFGYQLLRLGLADTAAEAERFVRTATIIGAVSPQLGGTADAINEINMTIANMSWRRLDQLGLSVSDVKERMQQLKSEVAGLSTEDAFRMAVLGALNEQADQLGDNILEISDATDRLRTRWSELKSELAETVAVQVEKGAEGWDLADQAEDAADAFFAENPNISPTKAWAYGFFDQVFGTKYLNEYVEEEFAKETEAAFQNAKLSWERQMAEWMEYVAGAGPYAGQGTAAYEAMMEAAYTPDWYRATGPYAGQTTADYERMIQDAYAGQGPVQTTLYGGGQTIQYSEGYFPGQENAALQQHGMSDNYLKNVHYWDDYYSRMQESSEAYFANARENAALVEAAIGGLTQAFAENQNVGTVMGETLNVSAQQMDALKAAADRVTSAVEEATFRYTSLSEAFGVVDTGIPVEVYGDMEKALRDANVEQETMNAALAKYEELTGMANDQTRLYSQYQDELSRRLADGVINAETYANIMAQVAENAATGPRIMEGADQWLAGVGLGGGEQKTGMDETSAQLDEIISKFGEVDSQLNLQSGEFQRVYGTEVPDAIQPSIAAINEVHSQLNNLRGVAFEISVRTTTTGGEIGQPPAGAKRGGNFGSFAEGGWTGAGGESEIAGVVHRGEYVVPQGGALVLQGGRSSDKTPIVVENLNIFGNDARGVFDWLTRQASDRGYGVKPNA